MNFDDFLLSEYSALREESRHNDDLRSQMIRFFIGLVTAIFGFIRFVSNPSSGVMSSKWMEVLLLTVTMLIGVGVLVFHAVERAKNKENDYVFDCIRSYFWHYSVANQTSATEQESHYPLPTKWPSIEQVNFGAWGTDFIYSLLITLINMFLVFVIAFYLLDRFVYQIYLSVFTAIVWGVFSYSFGYIWILKRRQKRFISFGKDSRLVHLNKELHKLSQDEEMHMDKEFENYDKLYPRE